MGNCWGVATAADDSQKALENTTDHKMMQQGLLRDRKTDVYEKYVEKEVLGQGSMGHVARVQIREGSEGGSAFHHSNGKKKLPIGTTSSSLMERRKEKVDYALKSILLDRVSPVYMTELKNEIDILKGMDHPNIVKAYEIYSYNNRIYLILELCDGGDLYTRLPYSEKRAASITGKLMSAVKYMHDNGIVHRDLKFENIMFENQRDDAEIKVIDFGLSKKFLDNRMGVMHEGVGTLYSMSPQVLQGVYTSKADLWSCGVITYMLLSSHRPFYHKLRNVMIDRIMRADYSFAKDYWDSISDEAKNFIDQLLVLDPKKRMDAGQALEHIWLSKEFPFSDRMADQLTSDAVKGNLINYKNTSPLTKIILNVIAHKSSTAEILELRKVFDEIDKTEDGVISYDEFEAAMKKTKLPLEELHAIFESIDVNRTGHIMYTEFIAAALHAHGHIEEERVAEAFDRLDCDENGFISRQNLRDFLGKGATAERIDELIKEADADNDGQISYQEFLVMFRKQTNSLVSDLIKVKSDVAHVDEDTLVGIDTKIPGGIYDSQASKLQ